MKIKLTRSFAKKLRNVSIAKKLYFVMGIMALLIVLELVTLFLAMHTLSSVRAYVGAEGFWSKGQKNAIYHLQKYGYSHSEVDHEAFHKYMQVPLGDNIARLEFLKPDPDLDIVRKGFIKGGNHPDDIEGMINLFSRFSNISYIAKAIAIWSEADPIIAKLSPISEKLHAEITSPSPSQEKIDLILTEITPINLTLSKLEDDFSNTLGEGARWLENLILKLLFTVALTVEISGILLTISVSRGISKGIDEIVRVADKIAIADFSEKAKVYSKDEIGVLANSFNAMSEKLEQNIDYRKNAEVSLRIKTRQLEEAQESAHIGSWTWDIHANTITWSDELYRIYGLVPGESEVTYENFLAYTHPDDREYVDTMVQMAFRSGEPFSFFYRVIRPDSSVSILNSKGNIWKDTGGNIIRLTGTAQDVSEIKFAEEAILNAKAAAEESTKVLQFKNIQLVDFCNIVSHNLRAPLVNISMLVDYIEQCEDETERQKMLPKIKPVINHLNEVLNELVESIQVRYHNEIKFDRIVLEECISEVLKGFESQIESSGADIRVNFNEAPIISYPTKYINSIFTNLISNALKYQSPERIPVIQIKTENRNSTILLSVSDNGLGIDLEMHKDRIFKIRQVFHKHPEARGFGLFMTKTQVDAMGGNIRAESTLGKGTTFFIEIKKQTT